MKRSFSIFLTLLLLSSGMVGAAAPHHQHGAAQQGELCAGPDRPAELRCALAPSAAFDKDGGLWVAWTFAGHVYVSYSADRGKSFAPPVAVNRTPEPIAARGENRPKIALDGDGRVFVSWTMPLAKRYTGDVRFSRSLDGGKSFSVPITVNDNRDITSHRFDVMGVNARGDIYIAWLDKRDRIKAEREGSEYRGAALYYALSEDHGASFKKNKKVIDHSCECCRVAMAMDVDQLPVVMWRNIYGQNTRDHALVKFRHGNDPGEPVRVSYDEWRIDACPHHGPAIAVSEEGRYHAVWFNNAPQRHGIFYAYSEDRGVTFSAPVSVGNYDFSAAHADVLNRGGTVFVVWGEYDGKLNRVLLMRSGDGGNTWQKPSVVATTQGEADYPFLLSHGKVVYLAWHTRDEGYRLIELDGLVAE